MSHHMPVPMQRESKDDDFAIGYMDLTDFRYELGAALGGNVVFPSIDDCRANKGGCIEECGIVEVEIRARRIVQQPTDDAVLAVGELDGVPWVIRDGIPYTGPFDSNEAAWRWLDKQTYEGRDATDRHNRIRDAFNGSLTAR